MRDKKAVALRCVFIFLGEGSYRRKLNNIAHATAFSSAFPCSTI